MMRLKLAAAWVGVQLLFFVAWSGREQLRLSSGESILVKVVPVDPRDLLRGQYLNLAYEFSRPWDSTIGRNAVPRDAPVWVVLRRDGAFHIPAALLLTRPPAVGPDQVVLQGRSRGGRYVFGVEQYFVPERTETPSVSDLTVRLRVTSGGVARIEQVYVREVPWP